MESEARVPLFQLSFWSNFSKILPKKWRNRAQKSGNIWHKPSRRCLRASLDISPPRVRAEQSGSVKQEEHSTTEAGVQNGVTPALSRHCPEDRLFPFSTEAGHSVRDWEQAFQSMLEIRVDRIKGSGNNGPSHEVFWGSSFTVVQ